MPSTMLWPGVDADHRGQHAGHAVPQVARAGAEEVHQVAGLEREEIVRILHVVEIHGHRRRRPVAPQELLQDPEVRSLAIVHRETPRSRDDLARLRRGLRLGGEAEEVRLEDVGHDEAGRRGQRAVDRGHRIAPVHVELAERLVEVRDGVRGGAGHAIALAVLEHPGSSAAGGAGSSTI